MTTREKKKMNKKRKEINPGPITRRQQTEALRQIKGHEIAKAVSDRIRDAVDQQVETCLKAIKDTMLNLIDRVTDIEARQNAVLMRRVKDSTPTPVFVCNKCGYCGETPGHDDCNYTAFEVKDESDSDSGQERAETVPVLEDVKVVSYERLRREECNRQGDPEGLRSR